LRDDPPRECGSNVLSGVEREAIARTTELALATDYIWTSPREYLATDVSSTVARIVLGR
jgi:UDP-N-acetylglucosamine 2-epimerase (non-hydrolysing)